MGLAFGHFIEDALDHSRGEFFGGEAVAAADDARGFAEGGVVGHAFADGGNHILVEGFASAARFLGAVKGSDDLDGLGQCGKQVLDREWAGRGMDGDHTDFLALLGQILGGGLLPVSAPEPIQDDDAFGIGERRHSQTGDTGGLTSLANLSMASWTISGVFS